MSKFKLPGHSFPGIKGFKSTSKADGRAASSAFQQETTKKRIPPTLTTTKQEDDAAAKKEENGTDNAEGTETEETKTKGTELTASDDLDWTKNYDDDDDDDATAVDPNLASAQKEGQGGWNYAAQEWAKASRRLNTPEAKAERLKKREARKAAKEEKIRKKELAKSQKENAKKTPSEKLDDQINENK